MRPRIPTLVFGIVNLRARCPFCGSQYVRASRESFEGLLARLLRLSAYRCRDCKRHFGVPPYARLTPSPAPAQPPCPACGSLKTVDSSGGPGGLLGRLCARSSHRCLSCRLRFVATDRRQLLANVVLLGAVLAALALGTSLLRDTTAWSRPASQRGATMGRVGPPR